MPKTRVQKKDEYAELSHAFDSSKSVVIAQFSGLNIHATEEFRREMRQAGSKAIVAKKTLLTQLLKEKGVEGISLDDARGTVMLAFGLSDEIAPAKIVYNLAKKNDVVKIWAGMLDRVVLTSERVQALATLPSKEELIAKTVGTIKAPISGFVNLLAGNVRSLVTVLHAIKEVKS